VDVTAVIKHHLKHGKKATVTATQAPGRFGSLHINGDLVTAFEEKPIGDGAWINGGYFVLEPEVIDLIDSDSVIFERKPLEVLASSGELSTYKHHGFWQPVDTLRDKTYLEDIWASGRKW
jgi:glucose-1-phosphate cytidylyltransferase